MAHNLHFLVSEPCLIRVLLIEKATVSECLANVPASKRPILMAYLSTSEWVLLAGLVLIALVLVARKPNEY